MAGRRQALAAKGTQLAFVHMGDVEQARPVFARYGLGDVPQFSDPKAILYRAFGLRRVPFWHFLTWKTLRRGYEGFRAGHGLGRIVGDGLRMPGVFLLHQGQVVRTFRHENSYDRPEYEALATCPIPGPTS